MNTEIFEQICESIVGGVIAYLLVFGFNFQEREMFYTETFIFETEWDAIDFAEECGDAFVRYTGSSWITQDEGDYGVVVQGFGL